MSVPATAETVPTFFSTTVKLRDDRQLLVRVADRFGSVRLELFDKMDGVTRTGLSLDVRHTAAVAWAISRAAAVVERFGAEWEHRRHTDPAETHAAPGLSGRDADPTSAGQDA